MPKRRKVKRLLNLWIKDEEFQDGLLAFIDILSQRSGKVTH